MEMGSGSLLQVSNGNKSFKFGSGSSSCSSSKSSSNGCSSSTKVNNNNNKQAARCQVEGCSVDLSGAKAYYGRHKVCAMHSKSPMVIVAGQHQRFCQQCSRFHQLTEFDQGKRSCRRRLAGHNERRRKPPPSALSSRIGLSPSSFHADNSSRLRSFLMNFAYPQLSGRNAWTEIGAGDRMTSKKWQGGTWLPVSDDSGSARSLLSPAPFTTTATATTSTTTSVLLSNDCFDQASIIPCKDGFGSWGFPGSPS